MRSTLSYVCRDIGGHCPFWAEAPTEAELMAKIASHEKNMHRIDPVPAETEEKIRKAIRNSSRPHKKGLPGNHAWDFARDSARDRDDFD